MISRFIRAVDLRVAFAIAFTAASISLWVTAGEVPPPLLAVTCLCIGVVIGMVSEHPSVARPDPVALPYIPEEVS